LRNMSKPLDYCDLFNIRDNHNNCDYHSC
jgi:hypothetical protein